MEEMKPEEQQDPSQTTDRTEEQPSAEQPTPEPSDAGTAPEAEQKRTSAEEALAEMRRSLREEETQEKTGFAANVGRLGKRLFGRKPKPAEEESFDTPSRLDDMVIPETPAGD